MPSTATGVAIRRRPSRPLLDLVGTISWVFVIVSFFVGTPWIENVVLPLWIQLLAVPGILILGVLPLWGGRRHHDRVAHSMGVLSVRANQASVANRWGLLVGFDDDLLLSISHGTFCRAGDPWLVFLRSADSTGALVTPRPDLIDRLWRGRPRTVDRGLAGGIHSQRVLREFLPPLERTERVLRPVAQASPGLSDQRLWGAALFIRLLEWPRRGEAIASVLDDIARLLTKCQSRYRLVPRLLESST